MNTEPTAEDLKAYRSSTGLSQANLAEMMGMKLRAYQDLESGVSQISQRHWQALETASLRLALMNGNVDLALPSIRRDALDFAAMVRGDPRAEQANSLTQAIRVLQAVPGMDLTDVISQRNAILQDMLENPMLSNPPDPRRR